MPTIESTYYQESLSLILESPDSASDRSLVASVRRILFATEGHDLDHATEDEQDELFASHAKTLINLMDEEARRKAPVAVRGPAQVCVAAIVGAQWAQTGKTKLAAKLTTNLMDQVQHAAAYCPQQEATDLRSLAPSRVIAGFPVLLMASHGLGDVHAAVSEIQPYAKSCLWHFLDQGYRFFGLPPSVHRILDQAAYPR